MKAEIDRCDPDHVVLPAMCCLLWCCALQFKLTFPFRSAQQVVQGTGAAASYLLTYLDEDMLIGRGPQGTFIFSRVQHDSRVGDDS
jgi:hypothetical protein